ncbi:MAG TPA: thymidine phosphorylase, partial [bacterium]|nr:thymidine phosphorylase [bacterium]
LNTIGRMAGAPADKKAGVMLHVRAGTKIKKNDTVFTIYSSNKRKLDSAYMFVKNNKVIELRRIILQRFS